MLLMRGVGWGADPGGIGQSRNGRVTITCRSGLDRRELVWTVEGQGVIATEYAWDRVSSAVDSVPSE